MDKLDELRLRYLRSLPQKSDDIRAQWELLRRRPHERALLVELHQQVHRLSGSAPAYGFDEIGALARPLDQRLAEWLRSDADDRLAVSDLLELLAASVSALAQALAQAALAETPPG